MLEADANALDLQKALIARGALPTKAKIDAFHVAIAAIKIEILWYDKLS